MSVFPPMFTDSHCHLTFPELASQLPAIRQAMQQAQVERALCICTTMEEFGQVHALALAHDNFWCSVGVHPDNEGVHEPSVEELLAAAQDARVVAIGETGLDYYQMDERKGGRTVADMDWQRKRFRTHIRAAQAAGLPMVIHTRCAADDTLAILREEGEGGAQAAGGVFHCFTESLDMARAALDLGYCISFSGIITFKSAAALREVVRYVPLDRCLIETDSPYLAPAPHRGKENTPAFVPLVALQVAQCKGISVEEVAEATTRNFLQLFPRVGA